METLMVAGIVIAAASWVAWRMYGYASGKETTCHGCDCSQCAGPHDQECGEMQTVSRKPEEV